MKKTFSFLVVFVFLLFPIQTFAESSEFDQFETIKKLIEMICENSDNGDIQVTCNESGFIIRQSMKEVTDLLWAAHIVNNSDILSTWKEGRENLLSFYNSIYEFIETCGIANPNLLYMFTDPTEPDAGDTIFLAIYNGEVIYDMLAE